MLPSSHVVDNEESEALVESDGALAEGRGADAGRLGLRVGLQLLLEDDTEAKPEGRVSPRATMNSDSATRKGEIVRPETAHGGLQGHKKVASEGVLQVRAPTHRVLSVGWA